MRFKGWTYKRLFFFFQKSGSGVFFSHVLHFVYELYWQEENFKRVNSQQLERTENHGCFWNKCFCGSLGTADCTSAGWSLLQCGAQQVNHTEITHLALFLSVRAIPALFLLLVLCVTLTERPLILPNTFCPSEFFFFFFDWTENLWGNWVLMDWKGFFPPLEISYRFYRKSSMRY